MKYLSLVSTKLMQLHSILLGSWTGIVIYSKTINYTKNYAVSANGILYSGLVGGAIGIYTCNLFI